MDEAEDSESNPLNDLIGMLAFAIEIYEKKQEKFNAFREEADRLDPAVSVLKLLMEQNALGVAIFKEEIGSKSLVSMILSGQRSLTKDHISKLSQRFNICPAIFFARPNQLVHP